MEANILKILFEALNISYKAAILIGIVIYYFERKGTNNRLTDLEDGQVNCTEYCDFKRETERQLKALWEKIDVKLGVEIPSYFKEIKDMWHDNDKQISNQKIEFANLNKKVDELAKRQDTLISNTIETLSLLVKDK